MGDVRESCVAKHFLPFFGGKQMGGDRKFFAPRMAIRIVAIIVDQDPGRAAFVQDAINFADALSRVRPVVRKTPPKSRA